MENKMIHRIFIGLVFLGIFSSNIFAMEFTSKKLAVWKRGESISNEEFIAANEAVVDYIAKLNRPTEPFKAFVYQCQIKSRLIMPSLVTAGGQSTGANYIYIHTMYDIKDCVSIN